MPRYKRILDNDQGNTVADFLKRGLAGAEEFRLVSAYFSIYGYELLADELDEIEKTRFLFGDPTSVDRLDPKQQDGWSFGLTELGLVPTAAMRQKQIARKCHSWVRSRSVEIRSIDQPRFLHGKLYIGHSQSDAFSVVGSSNFTRSGLGKGARPNLEINLASDDHDTIAELRLWFENLWNNPRRTSDVKPKVLAALSRFFRNLPPEIVYFKTLFELFRAEIESRREGEQDLEDIDLFDTRIWNALYEFQKDGVKSVISRLKRHNGCILADSVGLGKTYTALAVIKYFELRNQRVLVLCPSKLRSNWGLYPEYASNSENPFLGDRFNFTVLAHTDLSRDAGMSGSVNLEQFNWGGYDLIVIDESHNFRNVGGSRYQRLLEEAVKSGAKSSVLMLSATPVNTSLMDIRNQVYLMTEGQDDSFRVGLGIGNIGSVISSAQKEFKRWETEFVSGEREKSILLDRLGPDFFALLGEVSISRSRRQIKDYYQREMERVGHFPEHGPPTNEYPPTDLLGDFSYAELADEIDQLALSIYRPSSYLKEGITPRDHFGTGGQSTNFTQFDRERFLIGMIRTNYLKRLESSAHSLACTLRRTISKIDELKARIDRYDPNKDQTRELGDSWTGEDTEDEDLLVGEGKRPYRLGEIDLEKWSLDIERDHRTLSRMLKRVNAVTPERDGKLFRLRQIVRDRLTTPTVDLDGREVQKLIVFTTFTDTAEYLYENLYPLVRELGMNCAMVSGTQTHSSIGANRFDKILSAFAPKARNRRGDGCQIDLLIATDCISEGQNLQDCDTVLNFDIHWNPVRLIQRLGRIDRIGSRNRHIRMTNFWPTEDMERYLRLESRVQARMVLADVSGSGDDDPLSREDISRELNFRDEQLIRLRDEVLDFDELSDSVVMSDFTLDYFLSQLLRFLEGNRRALESIPMGALGVTALNPTSSESHEGDGVIFVLRQREIGSNVRSQFASPVFPYFLVYIHRSGRIRFGCANARQILNLFETACVGKLQAENRHYDWFSAGTSNGQEMGDYDQLLAHSLAHIRQSHESTQLQGLKSPRSRGFVLARESESPRAESDFELVSWLVIAPD